MLRGPERVELFMDVTGHLGYLYGVFRATADTYANSVTTLESWKGYGQDGLVKRLQKSCVPLKMNMSGLYFVDHGMMLSMWAFVLDGTVNLVLSGSVL